MESMGLRGFDPRRALATVIAVLAVTPAPLVESVGPPVAAADNRAVHSTALSNRSGPSAYVPLFPVRVFDSRLESPGRPAAPLTPGTNLAVNLAGVLPPGATAVSFNLTATGQQASGHAVVTPGDVDATLSGTSTLNWSRPLHNVANGYISKVSTNRHVNLALQSNLPGHLVLDVTGYFAGSGEPGAAVLQPANSRIYDGAAPMAPGASMKVGIDAPAGVAVTAAAIDVTVTNTQGPGFLTVAQDRDSNTSSLNWTGADQTVANALLTGLAPDGTFTVTNNGVTPARVVIDLAGVFVSVDAAGGQGAYLYPLDPARIHDSRVTGSALGVGEARKHTFPVPADAVAVVSNATVTGTAGNGYLYVGPLDTVVPLAASVRWVGSNATVANGAVNRSTGDTTLVYLGGQTTSHYVLDVGGYFR